MRYLIAALIVLGALSAIDIARADSLTCAEFIKGAVLEDPDVMNRATQIIQPLMATGWYSEAMRDDSVVHIISGPNVLLRQIERDCARLPGETVDDIVSVHLKVALREQNDRVAQQHANDAAAAIDATRQQKFATQDAAIRAAIAAAPPAPVHIPPTLEAVGKLTCGQYLRSTYPKAQGPMRDLFTETMQKMADADPVARESNTNFRKARRWQAADGYCFNNPTGKLAEALQQELQTARDFAPKPGEMDRWWSALRAKPNKSAEEQEQVDDDTVGLRGGPRYSCGYVLAYDAYNATRHPESVNLDSMASISAREKEKWCKTHLNATGAEIQRAGFE